METFYTIYKITNTINKKVYIGKHKTQNLDDGYMGSGKLLIRAIKKHGLENFSKQVLFIFDNEEEMNRKESELVNENFVNDQNTYNLCLGGHGGFSYINSEIDFSERNKKSAKTKNSRPPTQKMLIGFQKISESTRRRNKEGLGFQKGKRIGGVDSHTDETKRKIGEANSKHQKGQGNSQFGSRWVFNPTLKQNRKISRNDDIPDGWIPGRKMNFQT